MERTQVSGEAPGTAGSWRINRTEVAHSTPLRIAPSQPDRLEELQCAEEHRRRLEVWRAAGVPKRHRAAVDAGLAVSSWPESQRPAVRRTIELVRAGGLVVLVGGYGTGKTQLAAWLAWGWAMKFGRTVMYRRFADLLAEARSEAYADGGSDTIVVKRLAAVGLLILDEIQQRRWTQDEQLWLTRILDHRYGEMVPTILVANLTPDALRNVLDGSVIDRMHEGGAVVELVGKSQRGACNTATSEVA